MGTDHLEYGVRWLNRQGEIAIAHAQDSRDRDQAVQLVNAIRTTQQRDGRIPDGHLVTRTLDTGGLPVGEWQAAPLQEPPVPRRDWLADLETAEERHAKGSGGLGENECPCEVCDLRFNRTPTTERTDV